MRTAIVACVALWAAPALATTLLYRDLPELARTSDAVVRGRVVKQHSRWSQDKRRILTEVTVEVAETLKGKPPRTVTLVQPGGRVGDVGQKVSGLASFQDGEEVVLFLEKRGTERFIVNGMAQGKFRVERSTDKKAAFAIPDPGAGEAELLDPVTRAPIEAAPRLPLELDALRSEVARAVAQPPREAPVQKRPAQKVPEVP